MRFGSHPVISATSNSCGPIPKSQQPLGGALDPCHQRLAYETVALHLASYVTKRLKLEVPCASYGRSFYSTQICKDLDPALIVRLMAEAFFEVLPNGKSQAQVAEWCVTGQLHR